MIVKIALGVFLGKAIYSVFSGILAGIIEGKKKNDA